MYLDYKIAPIIKDWKAEARVKYVVLYSMKRESNTYDDSSYKLRIHTNTPGSFIGFHGSLVDKYREHLSDAIGSKVFVEFIETTGIV